MKKLIALLLCLALCASFSVTAFAAAAPEKTGSPIKITYDLMYDGITETVDADSDSPLAEYTPDRDDYLFGGWFLNALQFIFDYPLAFAMLGLAGLFRNTPNKKAGLVLGTFVGSLGRYIAAVLAGVFFWADGRTGLEAWTYSFAYNGSYMAIECVLCIVIAVLIGERILKSINRYK